MRHVFISYSHTDNDFAQLLRTELQNAGIQCWLALENLKAGEDWKEGIDIAIKSSFVAIVIISPESDHSKYVTYEWALAYGFGIPIVPVLYKKIEPPQKTHPRLESLQYEDFTSNSNRPWTRLVERLAEIQTELLRNEQRDPKIEEAIQALNNWDSVTIIRAAEMLGRRKVQSAIPELERLLDESDVSVQIAAIKALGEIGSLQSFEKIVNFVDSGNDTNFFAVEALGRIGDARAEGILLQQIDSDDYRKKIVAVNALRNSSSSKVKNTILQLLKNLLYDHEDVVWSNDEWNDEKLISSAFEVLSKNATKDDVSRLLELLKADNPLVLSGGVRLLGELQDESVLPQILNLTRSEYRTVRSASVSALEKFEIASEYHQKLEFITNSIRDEYEGSINFFYNYFGFDGLLYLLGIPESKAYWEVVSKIESVYEDSYSSRLVELLGNPDGRVKGLVADLIRRKKITGLCNELGSLVDDESSFVRGLAIRAIGELRCPKQLSKLKNRLRDTSRVFSNSSDEVRDFAVIALAKLKHKDAQSELQKLILIGESKSLDEAIDLFVANGGTGDNKPFETALYKGTMVQSRSALKVLARLEKKIDLDRLIEDLKSDDEDKNITALDGLSKLYPPLGLVLTLTQNSIRDYWEISEKLKEVIQPEHASVIIRMLSNDHYRVRAHLADVLGSRPDMNLSAYLVKLVDDDVEFVRGLAIRALGELRYKPAKDKLLSRLNDKKKIYSDADDRVCDYTAKALVKIGAQISIAFLESFKKNFSELVNQIVEENKIHPLEVSRDLIVEFLGMLQKEEKENFLHLNIFQLVSEYGRPEDAGILLDYFAQKNHGNWYMVEKAILKIADKAIAPKALNYLKVDDLHVKMVCLDILEAYGDSTVVNNILDLFTESQIDEYILPRAINVVSMHGNIDMLGVISAFSNSETEFVRCSVVKAFGRLKDENSQSRIIPFMDDQSYIVRAAAVEALSSLGNPGSLTVIMENLDVWMEPGSDYTKYTYGMACFDAIGKLGSNENIPMLCGVAINHENDDYRAAALQALGALNYEGLFDISSKMLQDENYCIVYDMPLNHVAAKMLYTIKTEKAKEILEAWLSELKYEDRPFFLGN